LNPVQGVSLASFFHNFKIDGRVLIFALCVTLGTGVIFGLVPALKCAGEREVMRLLNRAINEARARPVIAGSMS